MTGLEERYRRLLRLLPAAYRARWAEEMVDTFLLTAMPAAEADPDRAQFVADFGRPSLAEAWSVLTLAVRLRLGAGDPAGQGASRAAAYGAAVRLVGLISLLLLAAPTGISVATLVIFSRHQGQLEYAAPGPWWWLSTVAGLLWVGAYVAVVGGSRRTRTPLAMLALALSTVAVGRLILAGWSTWPAAAGDVAYLLLGLVPLAALPAFHPDAPPVRPGPWLAALPVAMSAAAALALLNAAGIDPLLDLPGIHDLLLLAITAGYLGTRRHAHWPLALAILAATALAVRLVSLLSYARYTGLHLLLAAGITEAALLFGALLALVPLARRDLAARPVTTPP